MRLRSAKYGRQQEAPPEALALPRRLKREQRTVEVMVSMYCRDHHGGQAEDASRSPYPQDELCPPCSSLVDYSYSRVAACRYGERKPNCTRCTTHCFRRSEREQIRAVMRYAGPRMISRHPYLAIRHLLDRRQPTDGAV